MDEIISILEEIEPGIDYKNCDSLIDDNILDSFAVLSLVSELEDVLGVEMTPEEMVPENFNSVENIWNMVCRLKISPK